jgi:hypothetical protein
MLQFGADFGMGSEATAKIGNRKMQERKNDRAMDLSANEVSGLRGFSHRFARLSVGRAVTSFPENEVEVKN